MVTSNTNSPRLVIIPTIIIGNPIDSYREQIKLLKESANKAKSINDLLNIKRQAIVLEELIFKLQKEYDIDNDTLILAAETSLRLQRKFIKLLLQLKHKTPTESVALAMDIIDHHFDAFTKKHYEKLLQKYAVSNEQLKKAVYEIEKLNPKPGGSYTGNNKVTENIVPDFAIRIVDSELELTLNGRNAPSLHVSKEYQEMLQTYKESRDKSNSQKDAVQFIKQKLDSAKWFIDAIRQRQETLFVTMNAIMHFQEEFFLDGDETKMKPMILKDIADRVGLDISTISRVANSKYVETPYGTKLIKEFFSEAMKNEQGEDVSTLEIKKILKNVIEEEDKHKPLPDDQLAEILKEKGYPIARRTIAKYREQLDIPVARMRKKM